MRGAGPPRRPLGWGPPGSRRSTVRFDATIDYPADVQTVAAMLGDEEFVRRKIAASGALDSSYEVLREGQAFTITTRRQMPTDQVPSSFRSFVGDRKSVV